MLKNPVRDITFPMDTKTLKNDLRELLTKNGIKQTDVAKATGVRQNNISRFLSDPGRDIMFSEACKLLPFVYPDKDLIGSRDREG